MYLEPCYTICTTDADVTALIDSSGTNILESTGMADNPFKYAGYQYDEETGKNIKNTGVNYKQTGKAIAKEISTATDYINLSKEM